MKRQDIRVEEDRIILEPEKLRSAKQQARAKITQACVGRIFDWVVDEEIDALADEMIVVEIADDMRTNIRAMLARGLGPC